MEHARSASVTGCKRRNILAFILTVAASPICFRPAEAATAAEINTDARVALKRLQAQSAKARALMRQAIAILMFPKIIKGGFIVGGQYGEGALLEHGKTIGYYSIAAGSFGLQAGGQKFSYALLFLQQSALDYLQRSDGWAIGSGPSVVVMDKGAAASTTSTTITQDVVAIPFGQHGLMAGLGLEGSKITRIEQSD